MDTHFWRRTEGILSTAALPVLRSAPKRCLGGDWAFPQSAGRTARRDPGLWGGVLRFFQPQTQTGQNARPLPFPRSRKAFRSSLLEQRFLSARGVKLGGADPGAGPFAASCFIGERKATLPVCKSEESLIKLIFCCWKYNYTCFCGALRGSRSPKARADGGKGVASRIAICFFATGLVHLGLVCLDPAVCMWKRKTKFRWLLWGRLTNSGDFCMLKKNLQK